MTNQQLENHFKVIRELLKSNFDEIKRVIDRHEVNTDKEIGDLQDFTLELGKNTAISESIYKVLKSQTEKITDKVQEVVEPMIDETEDLHKTIKSKKWIAFGGKPFWRFWQK